MNYTFDTGLQTWALSTYADPNGHNLAGAYTMDGGIDAAPVPVDAGAGFVAPTLTFDSAVGSPSPGSLKMTATFTDYNQYVDAIVNLTPTTTLDLTGKTLHASLQVTSGTFSGGAQLHVGHGGDLQRVWPGEHHAGGARDLRHRGVPDLAARHDQPRRQRRLRSDDGDPDRRPGRTAALRWPTPATYVNAGVPVMFNIDTVTD